MTFDEFVAEVGCDKQKTLSSFGGNEQLMIRILKKFPSDPSYSLLFESAEKGDVQQCEVHAHTLKGVAANLGLDEISAVCDTIVKNIRNGDTADLNALLGTLKPMYEKAINAIESL